MKTLDLDETIQRAEVEALRAQFQVEFWRALRDAGAVVQLPEQPAQEGENAIRNP